MKKSFLNIFLLIGTLLISVRPSFSQDLVDRDLFKPDSSYRSGLLPHTPIRRYREGTYKFGGIPKPDGYKFDASIDTSDYSFKTKEGFDDTDLGYETDLDIDSYLNVRKRQIQTQIWDSLTEDYDLTKAFSGGDLARMLSAATGLSIPLPS